MSQSKYVNLSLPPGPDSPHTISTDEETFSAIPNWLAQYGSIVKVSSEKRDSMSYLVNEHEAIRHILVKNHTNYKKGPGFERVKMLLGNGIIVSDGAFWRRQRRMIQPAFGKKSIAKLCEQVYRCNQTLLKEWRSKAEAGSVINITDDTNRLSLRVILRVIFSEDVERLHDYHGGDPFGFLTEDTTRDLKVVLKFRELMRHFQTLIDWRRKNNPARHDFLDFFMRAQDKDSKQHMSDKELIDELMTAIIAGHETSAITLNWSWYFLATNADVEAETLAEISRVLSQSSPPSFEQLVSLEYTKQVVSEALRLYPPVWIFSRTAINDDKIDGWDIPAGTDIFISPYYMHRDSTYWPDADQYRPDRFTRVNEKQRPKQIYIPFSSGPRRCIGDFFAIVESQLHFGMMLQEFKMTLAETPSLELEPHINLRLRNGLQMRIENRK